MSSKPEFKNKYCTVWPAGQYGRNLEVKKSYKDKKTGEWKESTKFFENEIPALFEALKEVMSLLNGQDAEAIENVTNVYNDEDIPF
jgi:hypothetical protein